MGPFVIRVPYYIGDLNRDLYLEKNYPKGSPVGCTMYIQGPSPRVSGSLGHPQTPLKSLNLIAIESGSTNLRRLGDSGF